MRIGITLTSSLHVGDEYIKLTKQVAETLAKNGYGVVFGGTDYGMMGTLAATYKAHQGADLVGVMAEDLAKVTTGYKPFANLDHAIWCDTMGGRKESIIAQSDAFLILPGGYGTVEELVDIFGGKVNKLYDKPIAIYNHNGYYNTLIAFFDELYRKEFSKMKFSELVYISEDLADILKYYTTYSGNEVADKFVSKLP